MKFFLLACAVLHLAVTLANGKTKNNDVSATFTNLYRNQVNQVAQQLRIMVNNTIAYFERSCPTLRQRVIHELAAIERCGRQIDRSLTMCQRMKISMRNCTNSYNRLADECLGYGENGPADLMTKSMISILDHWCKLSGEDILELLNPCLFEKPAISTQQLDECKDQVNELVAKYHTSAYTPTIQTICSHLEIIKSCTRASVNLTCKNERTTRNLMRLLDAASAPCNTINEVQLT